MKTSSSEAQESLHDARTRVLKLGEQQVIVQHQRAWRIKEVKFQELQVHWKNEIQE